MDTCRCTNCLGLKIKDQETEIASLKEQVEYWTGRHQGAVRDVRKYDKKIKKLMVENEKIEERNAELKEELFRSIYGSGSECVKLRREIGEFRKRIMELRKELADNERDSRIQSDIIRNLQIDLDSSESTRSNQSDTIRRLRAEIDGHFPTRRSEIMGSILTKNKCLKKEKQGREEEIKRLKLKISQMEDTIAFEREVLQNL